MTCLCVLEACPTRNFSASTFSDHLTMAPVQVQFYILLCVEVAPGASATFISSKNPILNFARVQFKIPTRTVGCSTSKTRKCPKVQSFAGNADELRIHGAGNTLVGKEHQCQQSLVVALCTVHCAGCTVHCAGLSLSPSCAAPQALTALPASPAPPLPSTSTKLLDQAGRQTLHVHNAMPALSTSA